MTEDEIPTGPSKPKEQWYEKMEYDVNPINFLVGVAGAVVTAVVIFVSVTNAIENGTRESYETRRAHIAACKELDSEIARTFCLTEGD